MDWPTAVFGSVTVISVTSLIVIALAVFTTRKQNKS